MPKWASRGTRERSNVVVTINSSSVEIDDEFIDLLWPFLGQHNLVYLDLNRLYFSDVNFYNRHIFLITKKVKYLFKSI